MTYTLYFTFQRFINASRIIGIIVIIRAQSSAPAAATKQNGSTFAALMVATLLVGSEAV